MFWIVFLLWLFNDHAVMPGPHWSFTRAAQPHTSRHESSGDDDDGDICSSCKHLQAMIDTVAHHNASIAIDRNISKAVELAIAAALGSDGSNMCAITVSQHLNAMIVGDKNVPGAN
jgi:hypothetical protein